MKANTLFLNSFVILFFGLTPVHSLLAADNPNTVESTQCTDPRPQICTQDYRPVCATLQDGQLKTYANGCTACSDPRVTHYVPDTCPQDK